MLDAMRTLALDHLFEDLGDKNHMPRDLDEWYLALRSEHPEELFPYLVESGENIEKIYVIQRAKITGFVSLEVEDMTREKAKWLPFMRPSGPQGAQIGPIIKRSYSKDKGGGPSAKIINTTIKSFEEIAKENKPWSQYFKEITEILTEQELVLIDNTRINLSESGYDNILNAAIEKIGKQKQTVFLTVRDSNGNLPGQRKDKTMHPPAQSRATIENYRANQRF